MIAGRPDGLWPPQYDPAYRPDPRVPFWDRRRETLSADERAVLVLTKLQAIMRWCYERAPFYRKRWRAAGLEPGDIRSFEDFERVPTIDKADLRADQTENPPFGSYLCIEPSEIVRIHGTSGTSGRPTAFAWGVRDLELIAEAHARIMWSFGVRPSDTVFIGAIFSLYAGSWGALAGAQRLGAAAFPFGAGVPGQTAQAVGWMRQMRPSVFYGTPSYALRLAESAQQAKVDPRSLGLRIMFFSGEPGAGIPSTKRLIEETFDAICIDSGSMAELTPWMHLCECAERTGMHLWQDVVYAELLDPHAWRRVPFGSRGTPVYTHLERTSQPMIRLVSGDFAEWTDAACACGRTYPRFPHGIFGRLDDMLTVRGENVYPSAIEEVVRTFPELGSEYEVVVTRSKHLDELCLRVELLPSATDASSLSQRVGNELKRKLGVRVDIEFCNAGTLARTDLKSRRVRDERQWGR